MNRILSILCILIILMTIPAVMHAADLLPLSTQPLIEEKYSGWSGVLRIWIYEGWRNGSGTFSGWLNRCISSFERANNGVYVQLRYVDAAALTDMAESGVRMPDMILFPPNLLSSPENLAPLSGDFPLRSPLQDGGAFGGDRFALPVAAGGYVWALNRSQLQRIPADWSDGAYPVSSLSEEAHRSWSSALLALCSGSYASPFEEKSLDLPGIDLGLAIDAIPSPSATPAATEFIPCRLPADFSASETAYQHFAAGELAAIPVTQWEIGRLSALSDQGRGPDWALEHTGVVSFTDQLLYMGIVAASDSEAADRRSLCMDFLRHLLSDDCQEALSSCGAFSVTDAFSGYASYDPEAVLESALRSDSLIIAHAFADFNLSASSDKLKEFVRGEISAQKALLQLYAR